MTTKLQLNSLKIKQLLKFFIVVIVSCFVLSGCTSSEPTQFQSNSEYKTVDNPTNYINVQYRNDPVDINHSRWEKVHTSKSSFVNGVWYDSQNKYMIINLNGKYYHYCGLPSSAWSSFKQASSFGTYYNSNIKGNYDCRINPVPSY
ncbi:MAG: KTSC domain-containing protein [Patescibacteria group bacterium]|jgi:hypothetical protein